jgi:hypothetical protein
MAAPLEMETNMQNERREAKPLKAYLLSDDELNVVSGGDQVAHLPQSIHMDYSKLSINENPTRLC